MRTPQASVVAKTYELMQARRLSWAICIALGLALLPGCRLYEFLTGTGYYQRDPFLGPDCTSSMLLGDVGPMDEFDDGEPTDFAPDSEVLEAPTAAPDLADELPTEADPLEAPDTSVLEPELDLQPDDLEERATPSAKATPSDEFSEEPPFSLDYAEPGPDQTPPDQPPPPDQPAPSQLEDVEPLPEDPFPLDIPETQPTVPDDTAPGDPLEDMLDILSSEPDVAPTEPDAPARPERTPPEDEENGLDELDLFDDAISPDLEIDFPETEGAPTSSDGADLPRRFYPNARRPKSDSYFGRCLFPSQTRGSSLQLSQQRERYGSTRRPFDLSESTEIAAPRPGLGIFESANPIDEAPNESMRVNFEDEASDRR